MAKNKLVFFKERMMKSMKQRIKKYVKICLAGVLTLALAVQAFTGFGVSTKAADSESEYTEMKFGDWGVSEGSGTAYEWSGD